jgi:hypothetical protein
LFFARLPFNRFFSSWLSVFLSFSFISMIKRIPFLLL